MASDNPAGKSTRHPLWNACLVTALVVALFVGRTWAALSFMSPGGFLGLGDKVGVLEIKGLISESRPILKQLERYQEDKSIKAIVVRKSGETLSEEEVIEHCKQHLASYKKPTSVAFVEALPKTPLGNKVLKRELRERFSKK